MQCTNHNKQISLAMHNHCDVRQKFPCGVTMAYNRNNHSVWNCPQFDYGALGWGARILPYIEQQSLYDQIVGYFPNSMLVTHWSEYIFKRTETGTNGLIPWSISQTEISYFKCPSCPRQSPILEKGARAKSNYVGLCGPRRMGQTDRRDITGSDNTTAAYHSYANCGNGDYGGLFFQGHPEFENQSDFQPGLEHITDGTSNCLMISERDGGRNLNSSGEPFRFPSFWIGGNERAVGDVTFSTYYTPNTTTVTIGSSEFPHACTAASMHPGGVNASMADGSVRFVSETISAQTWLLLGDRQDGNAVSF
jgi:prepilin-type processing-associated H-X9-DG protein